MCGLDAPSRINLLADEPPTKLRARVAAKQSGSSVKRGAHATPCMRLAMVFIRTPARVFVSDRPCSAPFLPGPTLIGFPFSLAHRIGKGRPLGKQPWIVVVVEVAGRSCARMAVLSLYSVPSCQHACPPARLPRQAVADFTDVEGGVDEKTKPSGERGCSGEPSANRGTDWGRAAVPVPLRTRWVVAQTSTPQACELR